MYHIAQEGQVSEANEQPLSHSMRPHTHRRDAPRPGQMPAPGGPENLLVQHQRLALHLRQGRSARRLLRVVADVRRLQLPGRRQVRLLRGLQVPVRREVVPQCQQDGRVPWRQRQRRVPGRHGPVSVGGGQGAHADDAAAVRGEYEGGREEGRSEGGCGWVV